MVQPLFLIEPPTLTCCCKTCRNKSLYDMIIQERNNKWTFVYLCIINGIYNKSTVQGEIFNKYITTGDSHCGSLRDLGVPADFRLDVREDHSPFGSPCDTRPYFNLLAVKDLLHRLFYFNTSLRKLAKSKILYKPSWRRLFRLVSLEPAILEI